MELIDFLKLLPFKYSLELRRTKLKLRIFKDGEMYRVKFAHKRDIESNSGYILISIGDNLRSHIPMEIENNNAKVFKTDAIKLVFEYNFRKE